MMIKKKRITAALLALGLGAVTMFSQFPVSAAEETAQNTDAAAQTADPSVVVTNDIDGWPQASDISSTAAIVMETSTNTVLYSKNADQPLYPASAVKIMTCLIALENSSLDDTVTFSHDAVYNIEPGSAHIAILEGETLTLEQVLRAIILRSANEASNGVAEYVDGSVEAFAKHMTERAKELGCTNTNFVNANGLFDENHYTTAHDMALIARELLKHEEYRSMMSETDYEIPPTNLQTETRYLHGQHQMLNPNSIYYYKDAIGGKTGYTVEAGNTLVTYAERDGLTLIAVVMKCNGAEHYTDTAALFDYGFANYKIEEMKIDNSKIKSVRVKKGEIKKIKPKYSSNQKVLLPKNSNKITYKYKFKKEVKAPIKAGDTLGEVEVYSSNNKISTIPLKSDKNVKSVSFLYIFKKMINNI